MVIDVVLYSLCGLALALAGAALLIARRPVVRAPAAPADDPCPACAECVGRQIAREVYGTPGVMLVPIVCQGVHGVAGPFAVRWGDA